MRCSGHFADKLPVSRLQRDLTDSTVLRNVGVAIGHAVLSFKSLAAGLEKIELDAARVAEDLNRAWEVLGEAVQTVMRAHGIPDAYDKLKSFTRGRPVDEHAMREFIASLAPAGRGKGTPDGTDACDLCRLGAEPGAAREPALRAV